MEYFGWMFLDQRSRRTRHHEEIIEYFLLCNYSDGELRGIWLRGGGSYEVLFTHATCPYRTRHRQYRYCTCTEYQYE